MPHIKTILAAILIGIAANACTQSAGSQAGETGLYNTEAFKNYWYAGKAEVNAYDLEQTRYGEVRSGKAMLIFVTEGFSKSKQVKLDNPKASKNDNMTVMKLNYTKNFVTGIYPYSMMLSTFTPVSRNQFGNTLKVSMTSQEWCGHVFSQMNLNEDIYEVTSYSYFEKEGDTQFETDKILLEDELFNLIRLDPDHIPLGQIKILPGLFFTRLKHENLKPEDATLSKADNGANIVYTLKFAQRQLTIVVDNAFPYQILGWEEDFIEGENKIFTRATLDKTLYTDYWRKNKNEHLPLRDSLGLSRNNY